MNNQQSIEAAGGIILNERGELLMIFRREKWDLPKGKIDAGETAQRAAVREVAEETGIMHIKVIRLVGTTEHEYLDPYTNLHTHKTTHWFEMFSESYLPMIPQLSEGITFIRWVTMKELPYLLTGSYDTIRDIIIRAGLLPASEATSSDN
ncbi:MAG: NUDIX hydrolase [Sediminibacterium sp.]